MSRQHHYLKTETEFYQAVESGRKTFEVRLNDRNFKEYDMIHLEEVVQGIPTGRRLEPKEITYVLKGGQFGIAPEYCIFCWHDVYWQE